MTEATLNTERRIGTKGWPIQHPSDRPCPIANYELFVEWCRRKPDKACRVELIRGRTARTRARQRIVALGLTVPPCLWVDPDWRRQPRDRESVAKRVQTRFGKPMRATRGYVPRGWKG
jgi:hypothetical protein